jgi:prephenate dehydratase
MKMNTSKKITGVAYLGPQGTFCHEATLSAFGDSGFELIPASPIPAVLATVDSGDASYGVVPIENSVDGQVTRTMDLFIFDYDHLYVRGEMVLPVSFAAFRRHDDNQSPKHAMSHPVALAQCRKYLQLHDLRPIEVGSTAEACKRLSESSNDGTLAIASFKAGQQYKLDLVSNEIEDFRGAATRFYIVGRDFPPQAAANKSIVIVIPESEDIGTLVGVLQCFSKRRIDILSIHSRPLRASIGQYCFVISFKGHIQEPETQEALSELFERKTYVKFLGSFPMWSGLKPSAPFERIPGGSDTAGSISDWLSKVQGIA